MRNYQNKSNAGALPDSITTTKFGAGEFNSIATELENAVSTSGQTLAPADGTGEVDDQLAMALAIYGAGGAQYHEDTGVVNAYVLNPAGTKESPPAYFDGFSVVFEAGTVNTTASTVNVASLGVKSITLQNGSALTGGELSGTCCLKYNSGDDRFELIYSSDSFLATSNYYEIDESQADQGATSTNPNTMTIYDVATLIGTSKNATIHLSHNPVAGNQTLYTFDTSLDLTTYSLLKIKADIGAEFNRTTGDEILTLYSPENLELSGRQKLVSEPMLSFSKGGVVSMHIAGMAEANADNTTEIEYASQIAGSFSELVAYPGTYIIGSRVEFADSDQKVKGIGGVTFQKIAAGFSGTSMFFPNSTDITFEGFKLDGLDQTGVQGINTGTGTAAGFKAKNLEIFDTTYGIYASNNSNITIEDCYIHDVGAYPVFVINIADTTDYQDIFIRNNVLDLSNTNPATSTQSVLIIRGTSTHFYSNVEVSGNTFKQCTDPTNSVCLGCEMRYVEGGRFFGNYSLDGSMLVSVAGSKTVSVTGNTSYGASFYAIEVAGVTPDGCENVTVSGNTIDGNGILNYGVGLQGNTASKNCTVTGNTIKSTQQYGIYVNQYWDDITFNGNNISLDTAGSLYGIYFNSGIEHITVTGNTFNGNSIGTIGVYFINCSYVTVQGNDFRGFLNQGVNFICNTGTIDDICINSNVFQNTYLSVTASGSGSLGNRITAIGNASYRTGGTLLSDILIYSSTTLRCYGSGSPEGVVTAGTGSIFYNRAGGAGTSIYIKESGTGNTGWVGK